MNIRQAILKAADHIEKNPGEFKFSKIDVPSAPHCGTPGCALGWIGTFAGIARIDNSGIVSLGSGVAQSLGLSGQAEFYYRLNDLDGGIAFSRWRSDASTCARALRKYADKYHPAERIERTGIPADVRAIFETRQANPDLAALDSGGGK